MRASSAILRLVTPLHKLKHISNSFFYISKNPFFFCFSKFDGIPDFRSSDGPATGHKEPSQDVSFICKSRLPEQQHGH